MCEGICTLLTSSEIHDYYNQRKGMPKSVEASPSGASVGSTSDDEQCSYMRDGSAEPIGVQRGSSSESEIQKDWKSDKEANAIMALLAISSNILVASSKGRGDGGGLVTCSV